MKLEKKLVQKLEQPSTTFNQESCGCRSLDQCIVGPPMFLGLSQLLVSWFLRIYEFIPSVFMNCVHCVVFMDLYLLCSFKNCWIYTFCVYEFIPFVFISSLVIHFGQGDRQGDGCMWGGWKQQSRWHASWAMTSTGVGKQNFPSSTLCTRCEWCLVECLVSIRIGCLDINAM